MKKEINKNTRYNGGFDDFRVMLIQNVTAFDLALLIVRWDNKENTSHC